MTAYGPPYQEPQSSAATPYGPPPGPQSVPPGGPPTGPAGVQSSGPDTPPARAHRPVSVGQILGGLLFVLTIVFIIENSRSVKIRLIFPEVKAPLYVAILIAAVLGGLITALLRYRRHRNHPPR